MNIVVFLCPYSANLGDGLLSLCLAKEMEAAQPGLSVSIQDLAGRKNFGECGMRHQDGAGLAGPTTKGCPGARHGVVAPFSRCAGNYVRLGRKLCRTRTRRFWVAATCWRMQI